MGRDILDIIVEKEYIELTASEREELTEYVSSEEEYYQMKHVLTQIGQIPVEHPTPKKETKEKLDALFVASANPRGGVWYSSVLAVIVPKDKPLHRQPIMQVAALVLLMLLVIPMFNNTIQDESAKIAQNEEFLEEETILEQKEEIESSELNEQVEAEVMMDERTEEISIMEDPIPAMAEVSQPASPGASGFMHPDGIFIEDAEALALSQSAKETEDLLSLLTATF